MQMETWESGQRTPKKSMERATSVAGYTAAPPQHVGDVIEQSVQDRRVGSFAGTAHQSRESMVHGDGAQARTRARSRSRSRLRQQQQAQEVVSQEQQQAQYRPQPLVLVVVTQRGPGIYIRSVAVGAGPLQARERVLRRGFWLTSSRASQPRWSFRVLWKGTASQRARIKAARHSTHLRSPAEPHAPASRSRHVRQPHRSRELQHPTHRHSFLH
jgi:hypothetical protein